MPDSQALDDLEDSTFDFIFCSNLPLHYDTGSVLSSPIFDDFMGKALKKLAPGGVLFYIFFASKHAKVAVPVHIDELQEYCKTKGLENYHIEKTNLLIEDTAELVLRK
ncbi:MAG TPA: class I SAM-dependent methyltransferase [Bacteroidales bacterium]|nr:class I SAM-dependent methyltransferase [Bacteroidales bacterium]